MNPQSVTLFTPEGPRKGDGKTIFFVTRSMFQEIFSSRELIWRLFLRDFSAKYRQSVFGILWAVLLPVITVGMFVGMNRSGLLVIGDINIPYPLYALIGLTIWNIFSVGLVASTQSLVLAGPIIVKINFPKTALPIAASGQSIFELLVRLVLVVITYAYYGLFPDGAGAVIGIISMIPLYLLTIGTGFVFSLIAGVYRDIGNILHIFLMVLMLVSPVLYPLRGEGLLARLNVWNPFNYLINVPRDMIIHGSSSFWGEYALSALVSVVVFYLGLRFIYLAQTKIAERI